MYHALKIAIVNRQRDRRKMECGELANNFFVWTPSFLSVSRGNGSNVPAKEPFIGEFIPAVRVEKIEYRRGEK